MTVSGHQWESQVPEGLSLSEFIGGFPKFYKQWPEADETRLVWPGLAAKWRALRTGMLELLFTAIFSPALKVQNEVIDSGSLQIDTLEL